MTESLLSNFHFQVEWGGTRLGFKEVRNLTVGIQVIEYRDGLSPEYQTRKIPGRPYYENIILLRGTARGDNEFFEWWSSVQSQHTERRDITIALLDENHNPTLVWKVKNAIPVKVTWTDLKSTANEVSIESLEIAHEGMTVESSKD
jgi:phage tail-like protein